MSIPGSLTPLFSTGSSAAAGGYQVSRSLRFNSADSAYLSRTPAVAGNRRTWTWAGWVKRSGLSSFQCLFSAGGDDNFGFSDADKFQFYFGGVQRLSTQVFRDTSAWYHLVAVYDSPNATAQNRIRVYVNGSEITAWDTNLTVTQNRDGTVNNTVLHAISFNTSGAGQYLPGYLADIHFIDGQALTPSSFTEVSATTGQLIPKAYAGTYTGNSFWLKFDDNSAATAATLGKDSFLLGNNWTPFNVSTTTGGPTSVAAASGALPVFNTTDTYGAVKGTGTRTDTNSASIVLALPMDGTNGGTSFGDQSAVIKGSGSAKTVTITGNTNTSTAVSKFYGSSGYFDGSGDRLLLNGGSDFIFGTSSFTVEAWVYKTDASEAIVFSQFYTANTSSRDGVALGYYGGKLWILQGNGTNWVVETQQGTFPLNSWVHIAASRDYANTKTYYFINGELVYTYTTNVNLTAGNNGDVTIGDAGSTVNYSWDGYINDLRIYKGVAKYTSNFNPPSSTASATTAAGNDILVDTPTSYGTDTGVGGEVRGNYCTWNPLAAITSNTFANGNLDITIAQVTSARGSLAVLSGKWYWEIVPTNAAGYAQIGICGANNTANDPQGSVDGWTYYQSTGDKFNNGSGVSYGNTYSQNDVVGIAVDLDAGKIWWSKNGTWQASGNPATGSNAAYTNVTGPIVPVVSTAGAGGSHTFTANFGQRAFAYTAPSGFKALCDTNIPEGTITTSGTFTGNASADGPFVYLNGVPTAMTINSNSVTFGTHADKLSNGFKVRNSTSTYNVAGSNTFSVSTTGAKFKFSRAQPNP